MLSRMKGRQALYFLENKRNFRALHFHIFSPITVIRSPAYLIRAERKLRCCFRACTFLLIYRKKLNFQTQGRHTEICESADVELQRGTLCRICKPRNTANLFDVAASSRTFLFFHRTIRRFFLFAFA